MSSPRKRWLHSPVGSAVRIVATYAIAASAWILLSDSISRAITVDPDLLTDVAVAKGVFFVVVTSVLLFVQIRNDMKRLQVTGERLLASEDRFRRVIDVSPVPMALSNADTDITLVNEAFVSLFGYTLDDVRTVSDWWKAAYPDPAYRKEVRDGWLAELSQSQATGDAFVPREAIIRCKDGSVRTMLVSAASLGRSADEIVVVFFDISERTQAEAALLRANDRMEGVLHDVIGLIGKVVEARDPYTQGHEKGVARICRLIAAEMSLTPTEARGVEVAALVHDVGKLIIPTEILTKPGILTALEYELIKGHSQQGHDILAEIQFDWPVADIVLQHHERMDGSGYPNGVRGDDILPAARVLMVADVVEAMSAHRPYRPSLGIDAAMAEIRDHPEKYDAPVVAACERLMAKGLLVQ